MTRTGILVRQVIKDLGKRHVTYGVASHHVPVMKQASGLSIQWETGPLVLKLVVCVCVCVCVCG